MPRSWIPHVFLWFAVALCGTASAQGSRLTTSSRFEPAVAQPGDTVTLKVTVDIVDTHHIYGGKDTDGLPTTLAFADLPAGLTLKGDTRVPDGDRHEPQPNHVSYWIEGRAVIEQDFEVQSDAADGTLTVPGVLNYMACTALMCDPPARANLEATLAIGAAANSEAADTTGIAAAARPQGGPAAFGGGYGSPAKAADGDHVTATARFEPARVKAGQETDLVVTVTVLNGWHVYGKGGVQNPITFAAEETFGIEPSGKVRTPRGNPHRKNGTTESWLEGSFEIRQRMTIADDEGEGELEVPGKLQFMVCDPRMCLPPDSLDFLASVEIVSEDEDLSAVAAAVPIADDELDDGSAMARADGHDGGMDADDGEVSATATPISWTALIWLAIAGGLFALAMPCTYPMIPITFSFFTKQADSRGGNVLALALTYGLGIVLMFSLIGAAFGAIAGFSDSLMLLALHPITNGIIGVIFVLFALSLFGVINLEPPRALQDIAGKASQKGGLGGVFLMGLCLVITSFTCTAPFVGTMIALSAAGGSGMVISGMAIFGLTMAIPFVILALVPGKVRSMPKAGNWMNTLKVTLGFVELAAAMKFLSNVDVGYNRDAPLVSAGGFLWVWAVIFAITALYLFGVFNKPSPQLSTGRKIAAAGFMVLAGHCMNSTDKTRLDPVLAAICPPVKVGEDYREHTIIKDDIPGAIARAKSDDKLLLLNFTGFN